ncbi:MAG TPA: glycoside hydrolase family 5 protein, partial [Candidatus Marinimicrobia bacterium]|nr:glycoside hydrolase family 5 protein [Candidatus Neomarinimicrobiota bacterium]
MDSLKLFTFIILGSIIFSCNDENNDQETNGIVSDSTVVDIHGLLQVEGNRIVNKNGDAVSLAGNSFFWSNDNWGGERYYTPEVVSWLQEDWNTTIVRA